MQAITEFFTTLSGWVWGPPLLVLLVGTGIYLTVRLHFLQFTLLPEALRLAFHGKGGADEDVPQGRACVGLRDLRHHAGTGGQQRPPQSLPCRHGAAQGEEDLRLRAAANGR